MDKLILGLALGLGAAVSASAQTTELGGPVGDFMKAAKEARVQPVKESAVVAVSAPARPGREKGKARLKSQGGTLYRCWTATSFEVLPFSHGYIYNPKDLRFRNGCGQAGSGGQVLNGTNGQNGGEPSVDRCLPILNADGSPLSQAQMDRIRQCACGGEINEGIWVPFVADCNVNADNCIRKGGAVPPTL